MTASFFSFFISFLSVFCSVFVLRPLATNFGLVDKPCSRKQHEGDIPLVGGLAIYVAITLCSFLITPFEAQYKMYLLSTSFMVLIGSLDDFYDIDARLRLIAQFLIGSLMVFGADLYISNLGSLFGMESVELGAFGPLFTVLAVVTCINAFNMTDGVDGLVGMLSLNTFLSLGILAYVSDFQFSNSLTSVLIGAIIAFLFFNFGSFKQGRYKIFMGDAGSMLMGLTAIWLITYSTQSGQSIMRPSTALWLIAIPLLDMFSVMIRRIRKGHSPLKASRDHFHHILLRRGYKKTSVSCMIALASAALCAIGVMIDINKVPDSVSILMFITVFVVYNLLIANEEKRQSARLTGR
ncbi:UDP-N-acetylglucosamine--undecaprenyl-phosphate N-acetylglucosaminephosphotransferase [Aestuariibacter sp. AA17]|uniref:Undecaprenyl-phosphate alpha-N-acetylglucosaminyl 1-phosphate transferase n=1 Tax=Fluctibacter corallii TaxID=2984329 RepID=A0ABT3A3M9_9ALTE|nr:UDP-N-acetylglucosamine--undecaprenyl-phosphate N-acetylglucosaminephosphotransferase [Aestuariibacter sp. AA17]MCV2883271.1 UDP-N-acetylglucosamine--undecaprenyl-phosphate N-acetylglucosaminephosphotransferase [Aestuariibacter sp. AA17]